MRCFRALRGATMPASSSTARAARSGARCLAHPAISASVVTAPTRRILPSRPRRPWRSPGAFPLRKPPASAFPSSPRWRDFAAPACQSRARPCWSWALPARSDRPRCRSRPGRARAPEAYEGHSNSKVEMIDASAADVAARVRELTGGKGADIVFNTVGDPYFQAAHKSLALRGRQILIAAIDRIVQFNILEFYRGQHTYVGIDTLGLSSVATGAVLRELAPGFAAGKLKPFTINPSAIYPLEEAKRAFVAVAGSSRDRVILKP